MIKMVDVSKVFKKSRREKVIAVDKCSLTIKESVYLGIAGNSGCGKSTLGRLLAGIMKPSHGQILYKNIHPEEVQIIFQHPESALNPKMTIEWSLIEPIRIHKKQTLETGQEQIKKWMALLGLSASLLTRYPHEISGGEAQRICICRALLMNPKVLILDEATSMLDVSTQANILDLLKKIRHSMSITMVMISHDLELLLHQCDDVLLMSEGRFIEGGLESDLGQEMISSFNFFYD